ncbi:MAG: hypothetical protein ACOCYV_01470 [Planctomycetota bacterium]
MDDREMRQTIGRLVEHEDALATLYSLYAESCPADAELWRALAADETTHAGWVLQLLKLVRCGDVAVDPRAISGAAVATSLGYVHNAINECQTHGVGRITALCIGRDLENSIIENRFYELFKLESESQQAVRHGLERETLRHRQMIELRLRELET